MRALASRASMGIWLTWQPSGVSRSPGPLAASGAASAPMAVSRSMEMPTSRGAGGVSSCARACAGVVRGVGGGGGGGRGAVPRGVRRAGSCGERRLQAQGAECKAGSVPWQTSPPRPPRLDPWRRPLTMLQPSGAAPPGPAPEAAPRPSPPRPLREAAAGNSSDHMQRPAPHPQPTTQQTAARPRVTHRPQRQRVAQRGLHGEAQPLQGNSQHLGRLLRLHVPKLAAAEEPEAHARAHAACAGGAAGRACSAAARTRSRRCGRQPAAAARCKRAAGGS
jgi:hypothetical protein